MEFERLYRGPQVWDEYPDRWGRRSVRTKSVFGCAHSSDMLAWRDYCCRCHHEIGLGSANCTLRRFSAVLGSVADQQCHQHSCGSNSGLHHHDHVCAVLGRRACDNPWLYFCAGLAAGHAYWVKEASVLFLFSFGLYIAVVRRWSWRWLYSGLGALIAFAANCMLMWIVTGHPFHGLAVMHSTVETQWTVAGRADSPFYYVKYLLFDIRHTWLLGYLAVIGVIYVFVRRKTMMPVQRSFAAFVLVWSAGLLLAFSIIPVSFSPMHFVMKQTNYMTIFLAPLAILSGFGLAQMRAELRTGALLLVAAGGFLIAAITQQDLRVFTANAQAAAHSPGPTRTTSYMEIGGLALSRSFMRNSIGQTPAVSFTS